MSDIRQDIKAFQSMQSDLEADHTGRWALIRDGKLISVFDTMEDAAGEAVQRFGSGPYLIRQIGTPPISLSISVMHHRHDAHR